MKSPTFKEVKKREAKDRLASTQQALKSSRSAMALQRRVSLVGDASKWQITNLRQVAKAMAKWA